MPTCKGMDRNEGNVGVMKDPYFKKEIKKQHAVSKMSQ